MKAIMYREFGKRPELVETEDPVPSEGAVVIAVKAAGLCLSDWHGWMGHDSDVRLPHVPGHEFSGEIVEVGRGVLKWSVGDRVTVPFVGGCGHCSYCMEGNPQVCPQQFQPGFTHWGSFAQKVEIKYADFNLVRVPSYLSFEEAACLGCRFTTAFRAVIDQGRASSGEWVAVHGCGGVGLSAVLIAKARGSNVIAVDPKTTALDQAKRFGADCCFQLIESNTVISQIFEASGGVHLSLDAYGGKESSTNSMRSLRRRGRHVQVGLITGEPPKVDLPKLIAEELEIIGSHGVQASRFDEIFRFIDKHQIDLSAMISQRIDLEKSIEALIRLDQRSETGVIVINDFS